MSFYFVVFLPENLGQRYDIHVHIILNCSQNIIAQFYLHATVRVSTIIKRLYTENCLEIQTMLVNL